MGGLNPSDDEAISFDTKHNTNAPITANNTKTSINSWEGVITGILHSATDLLNLKPR